jgi:hypothetical protein
MTATIKFTGQWKQAAAVLDHRRFKREVEPLLGRVMRKAAEAVRVRAQSMAGLADNKPLTRFIKGANTPGVDTGSLKQSIRVTSFGPTSFWVGIKKADKNYQKAQRIINGALVPVTDSMRSMFDLLAWASEGRVDPASLSGRAAELWSRQAYGWLPLSASTTHILIVPRPFLEQAYADVEIGADLESQIARIVNTALTKPARKR